MLTTLFSSKKKRNASDKPAFYNLERLLADLGIKFYKSNTNDHQRIIQEKKTHLSSNTEQSLELKKIAMNQLAYSKLFQEKMMGRSINVKKKDKIVLMSR